MHVRVGVGVVLSGWTAPVFVLEVGRGRWRVLAGGRRRCRTGRAGQLDTKCPSSPQRKQRGGRRSIFTTGRAIKGWLFTVILVDVAGGCGRRRLSGCSSCCRCSGNSGHGGYRWGHGPVSSDLLIGLFEILFQESDLLLHGVDQALHLSVCLLIEYFSYLLSGCYDVLHRFVA